MTLSPRAAAIRGDNYQHAIGWYWTCQMLLDPDIETIAIEDPSAGSFDDVTIGRREGQHTYIQAKSSNSGNVIVDADWLLEPATKTGQSPLQRFHHTYTEMAAAGETCSLQLWTNRGFDHQNPILGKLLDKKHDRIKTTELLDATKRSKAGQERQRWADHLGIDATQLGSFLDHMEWKQAGSIEDIRENTKPLMRLAGLRHDQDALDVGAAIVSGWVTDGVGPRTRDRVRREIGQRSLLAVDGTVLLAVNGIDREDTNAVPNVTLDFVDLYEGDDPFQRKRLREPSQWHDTVVPEIMAAGATLAAFGVRHVHVLGLMRHPMWFAVGRSLPEVRRWTVTLDQRGDRWSTSDPQDPIEARVMETVDIDKGNDIALAIGLTGDPTNDVGRFLRSANLPIRSLHTLGPPGKPSQTAVISGGWAMGWTRSARELGRRLASESGATHLHLFFQCPAGAALMLGHQWNVMPDTTIYEFVDGSYEPTITTPGN